MCAQRFVLSRPSPRKKRRRYTYTEMRTVTQMCRRMARRSAPQRTVEHTQSGHTHSHACAATTHAHIHGHTHTSGRSHAHGDRLRARFEHARCDSNAGGRMCVRVRLCVRASVGQRPTDVCRRLHFGLGECVRAHVCECVSATSQAPESDAGAPIERIKPGASPPQKPQRPTVSNDLLLLLLLQVFHTAPLSHTLVPLASRRLLQQTSPRATPTSSSTTAPLCASFATSSVATSPTSR